MLEKVSLWHERCRSGYYPIKPVDEGRKGVSEVMDLRAVATQQSPNLYQSTVQLSTEIAPATMKQQTHDSRFIPLNQVPDTPQTNLDTIDIVPLGRVPPADLHAVVTALEATFDCETTIADQQTIPEEAYDSFRDQYDADVLVNHISDVERGGKVLGITKNDLFYRRRNYVFGLAHLGGQGCVISTHRLKVVPYGDISTSSEEIAAARICTEAVHEIGHTFGLDHCDNSHCAMSFSPTVHEVDRKDQTLCANCRRQLP